MYNIFEDDSEEKFKFTKKIRLLEFFAGYGSQALAFKYLGIPVEHYGISEWAIKSIQAYKDMHFPNDDTDYSEGTSIEYIREYLKGRISANYNDPLDDKSIDNMSEKTIRTIYSNMMCTHNQGSICAIHGKDMPIVEKDKYNYMLTYSFPCQDLSVSGLGKGMARDSGTRSGMLWQVERILYEWNDIGALPDCLLMENVPEVIGAKNLNCFYDWVNSLEKLGYKSYWKILNAKDFNVPQNRRRCFMISILTNDKYYEFPDAPGGTKRLKDIFEENVDESYYLSNNVINKFVSWTENDKKITNTTNENVLFEDITDDNSLFADDNTKVKVFDTRGKILHDSDGLTIGKSAKFGGSCYGAGQLSPTLITHPCAGTVELKKRCNI